ncbi:hypothetical protein H8N03_15200 [Ramlibacter sp. USB13]|uniref:Uncharacterized protein n=1 Tax=Ramlibacter cellulosilyticus TaxID=2764187 RepID=A0A923MSA2_9BURK|nr:hypothetical protein [Ramlibacter cellulosilyticus]MBC5784298.1 hypothetical protein [Ramlibacter cellulosilyticus]
MRRLTTLVLAAFLAAPAAQAAKPLPPQVSEAAAVTVKVTPRVLDGAVWEFDIAFDTHSRELGDDLMKDAVLLGADGREVAPLEWKGAPPGGHHRAGVLRFQALSAVPDPLVLRIRRAGEAAPRTFRWTLK